MEKAARATIALRLKVFTYNSACRSMRSNARRSAAQRV